MSQNTLQPNNQTDIRGDEPRVLAVKELLSHDNLRIPPYQRPYKWQKNHVHQFIQDLIAHTDKDQYRIGNIVLHKNDEVYDIVDGQQRFITLLLILKAVDEYRSGELPEVAEQVQGYLNDDNRLSFSNRVSRHNIYQNYQLIKQPAAELHGVRRFLIHRVELVQFILEKKSEAFQ